MIQNPLYLGYGMLLLMLLGAAEYRGWSPLSVNEVKNVPKSVRDNPGAYRSHYRSSPRFFGGK
jgi:hypothetical protein